MIRKISISAVVVLSLSFLFLLGGILSFILAFIVRIRNLEPVQPLSFYIEYLGTGTVIIIIGFTLLLTGLGMLRRGKAGFSYSHYLKKMAIGAFFMFLGLMLLLVVWKNLLLTDTWRFSESMLAHLFTIFIGISLLWLAAKRFVEAKTL